MINGQELADIVGESKINDFSLPTWLYSNMPLDLDIENDNLEVKDIYEQAVYWTDTADDSFDSVAFQVVFAGMTNRDIVSSGFNHGVRPVVKILKSNL